MVNGSESLPQGDDALEIALLVDKICDQFESSWKAGSRPSIESFLSEVDVSTRPTLLTELIQVDICYRRQLGELPHLGEYLSRFPNESLAIASIDADSNGELEPTAEPPGKLAGYQLIQIIGSGSFGKVWKAWDETVCRFVAIKVPKEDVLPSSPIVQNFEREAKAAARLVHPNVVTVYEADFFDGAFYIACQYVDGPTLEELFKQQPPSHKDSAKIIAKLADGLSHAHSMNLVHRDIKPANILMNPQGEPLLTDFGLAKWMDTLHTIAGRGEVIGTVPYMSPEQATGGVIDVRSDVWSLGVVLYELLTRFRPFQGDQTGILYQIQHTIPKRPQNIDPTIPEELEAICWKAIQKQPSKRYQSAAEFRDDLQRFLTGQPVPVPRITWLSLAWSRMRSAPASRKAMIATPVALLMGIFGTLLASSLWAPLPAPPDGTLRVHITTIPARSAIAIALVDPMTGLPSNDPAQVITPVKKEAFEVRLQPGLYRLTVSDLSPDSETGQAASIEVFRTVPSSKSTPGPRNYQRYRFRDDGSIDWPEITIGPDFNTSDMIFIPGTSTVDLGETGSTAIPLGKFTIRDFYVSRREFSYSDFTRLPKQSGPHDRMRRTGAVLDDAMNVRYDEAMQWAENAGCRLLTELEFEYLARLIHAAHTDDVSRIQQMTHLPKDDATQLVASLQTIENVFDGQAEWVCGLEPYFHSASTNTAHPSEPKGDPPHLEVHTLRGGSPLQTLFTGIPTHFTLARWKEVFTIADQNSPSGLKPGCGFRVGRSASPLRGGLEHR